MAMVTTCPRCATTFKVAPEVLLSRNGRVRCGKCKQVFDGLMSLATLEEFQSLSAVPAGGAVQAAVTPAPAATIHWPALPGVPEVPMPRVPPQPVAAARLPDPGPRPAEQAAPPPAMPASARGTRGWWALAAVVAALTLGGQILYRYRSEAAANFPAAKPVLAQLCAWAGCSVPPLQQPAALNIEASDLQVVDKSKPHIVQLTATLRNRAAVDVGYPGLDLVLTDNREHTLARRVFVPADYLADAEGANPAIAANAETTVRIDMDISGLPAAGFRLNLTQAPSR